MLVKNANALTQVAPVWVDPSYNVVKQGWLAASLLTGKDFFSLQGSATKVVRVKRIALTLYSDLAHAGSFSVELVRESTTPATSGSATVVTPALSDSGPSTNTIAAATAIATFWPVTVTNGTGSLLLRVGGLAVTNIAPTSTAGSGNAVDRLVWDFGSNPTMLPTLRGAADFFTLRCVGGAPTSSTMDIEVVFEEADA